MATRTNNDTSYGKGLDPTPIAGFALAMGGVLGGLVLEGGRIADVAQITAAIIVLGGTIGAVMITTPLQVAKSALRRLRQTVTNYQPASFEVIDEIVRYATKARKEGIVSLEGDIEKVNDPFLHRAIMLSVDGTDVKTIREIMELEMSLELSHADVDAKVYESAGGYAPTIGILGAVIGLIQVMKHLDDLSQVGSGIAVAFVATIYGVGSANLLFLPIGQKIRLRSHQIVRKKRLMLEGVISLNQGLNPRLIRRKLETFVRDPNQRSPRTPDAERSVSREAAA